MFLYGKNSVLERLRVNPTSIKEVVLQDNFNHKETEKLIRLNNIHVKRVSKQELFKIKKASERSQGIIAKADEFKYASYEDLLYDSKQKKTFIFLDSIFDPHNLGVIMRISACFGGFAICIPQHKACEVNETVLHVASGAENYVPVAIVGNISNALRNAKKAGYWIAGTVVEEGSELTSDIFPFPLCLILGSEGKGISPGLQKLLDLKVSIPMQGANLSLNVATACSVFCYEITKQNKS
jgi:23S rRNA (guanosine2251-2'-O)-methyltransferase